MSPLTILGYSAVAVLVLGWLLVSFMAAGPRRAILEWLSASAMYLALFTLFIHLSLRAHAQSNTLVMVAFLFLCSLFGGGMLVSLYHTASAVRAPRKAAQSATN